ncbi:DNA polymerase IV [Ruminiclostridium cellobioparum]|uniref:DNA polymerase IV n=2 Tax=Ruminiclostridium cellobioparum TaxID=29355 RepID=S0FK06_RUMCE|nr:DNA polymerase IV [Ruminiclostridium cellobioparum]EMS69474.1 Nucleotidyltransferase/DNA polymerase involved in DNA repair [Ruminiclostridium cellobioparum subsp. termitidis CT1112]
MSRVIFLVDMNAFFISCEMSRRPEIIGKPAAVAGDPRNRSGIILAANYEARKFGVKTTMVVHQALKLCPGMLFIPPDHRYYEARSREVMSLLGNYSPVIEQNSIDEAWLDMTGTESLFGKPAEAAGKIMEDINKGLGLWCSIGISENKLLAKIASEIKKPMGITELWVKDIKQKLWPLKVTDMYGVGKHTGEKLNNLGILTIGDLAEYDPAALARVLGKMGAELQNYANGRDDSPVAPHTSGEMKSIGRSTTLSEDATNVEAVRNLFLEMCEEVGFDARRHDKKAGTVQITIKYSDFQSITRQVGIEPTYLTKEIFETGFALLRKNWNSLRPVRLIGVSISSFEKCNRSKQLSLFEEDEIDNNSEKEEKLEKTLDDIRNRHGLSSVTRAVQIKRPQ